MITVAAGVDRSYGLSTDAKPLPSKGAVFIETDTDNLYEGDGSTWIMRGGLSFATKADIAALDKRLTAVEAKLP